MFEIEKKVISVSQRVQQVLKLNYVLNGEDHDNSEASMSNYIPYIQMKQARLEAELKIAEAYEWYWRLKNRMI